MQEIFGYDGKLVIIAGISVLTWIFLVAGLATPWVSYGEIGYATLFEACIQKTCSHTYGCSSLDSTVKAGAAFSLMATLLFSFLILPVNFGRIVRPALFDRPQLPTVLYVSYGITAFMLLIGWACAFGSFHHSCNGVAVSATPGAKVGACGWLLLFAQVFVFVQLGIEWKMPAGKSASDNYNAVGSQPQHVAVSGNTDQSGDNQYNNSTGGNATGYSEVSEQ